MIVWLVLFVGANCVRPPFRNPLSAVEPFYMDEHSSPLHWLILAFFRSHRRFAISAGLYYAGERSSPLHCVGFIVITIVLPFHRIFIDILPNYIVFLIVADDVVVK